MALKTGGFDAQDVRLGACKGFFRYASALVAALEVFFGTPTA